MRLRLGLLKDPELLDRQIKREVAEAEKQRQATRSHIPTVQTEEQATAEQATKKKEQKEIEERARRKPRIRPLSEGRAIDLGATFLSESFIYAVSIGVLLFETWRSRWNANSQREGLSERLNRLEADSRAVSEDVKRREDDMRSLREQLALMRPGDGALGQPVAFSPSRVLGKSLGEANPVGARNLSAGSSPTSIEAREGDSGSAATQPLLTSDEATRERDDAPPSEAAPSSTPSDTESSPDSTR